jgi:hypothetical protein
MSSSHKKSLTATNLATHQHFNCDLYIHYTYHGVHSSHRGASGEPSELAKAHFERGLDWESNLYRWLDQEGLLLTLGSVIYTPRDIEFMLDLDDRDHFFVTGIAFEPPNATFAHTYNHIVPGLEPVKFGIAKPDLIEILREDGVCKWRVIDAKSSTSMKVRPSLSSVTSTNQQTYILGITSSSSIFLLYVPPPFFPKTSL